MKEIRCLSDLTQYSMISSVRNRRLYARKTLSPLHCSLKVSRATIVTGDDELHAKVEIDILPSKSLHAYRNNMRGIAPLALALQDRDDQLKILRAPRRLSAKCIHVSRSAKVRHNSMALHD